MPFLMEPFEYVVEIDDPQGPFGAKPSQELRALKSGSPAHFALGRDTPEVK